MQIGGEVLFSIRHVVVWFDMSLGAVFDVHSKHWEEVATLWTSSLLAEAESARCGFHRGWKKSESMEKLPWNFNTVGLI